MDTIAIQKKQLGLAIEALEEAVANGNDAALEGIWDSITGFFSTIGDFIDKKMSGALVGILEMMSSKDIYTRALTPEMREELVGSLKLITFSKQGRVSVIVPPYVNRNLLGFSKSVVQAAEGLPRKVSDVLDELADVTYQAVSGNGIRGSASATAISKAIHNKANRYITESAKSMSSTRTSNIRLNVAYGSTREVIDNYDLLRGYNDILETNLIKDMLKKVDKISVVATKISVDSLAKRDLLTLSKLMQSVAEDLDFTAIVTTDYINSLSSVQQHATLINNL